MELWLYTMGFTEDGEEISRLIDELETDAATQEAAIEMAEEALAHPTGVIGDVLALLKDGHDQTIWRKRLDLNPRGQLMALPRREIMALRGELAPAW
jgi:hypothetical protein